MTDPTVPSDPTAPLVAEGRTREVIFALCGEFRAKFPSDDSPWRTAAHATVDWFENKAHALPPEGKPAPPAAMQGEVRGDLAKAAVLADFIERAANEWKGANGGIYAIHAMSLDLACEIVSNFPQLSTPPSEASWRKGVYIASKTRHAAKWQALRASGVPINSTWIDEAGEGETGDWSDLWRRCLAEAAGCRALIAYCEPGDVLKGAWIEVGAALNAGVPVYGVGLSEFTIAKSGRIINCNSIEDALSRIRALSPPLPAATGEADVRERAKEPNNDGLTEMIEGARAELRKAVGTIATLSAEKDDLIDIVWRQGNELSAASAATSDVRERAQDAIDAWAKRDLAEYPESLGGITSWSDRIAEALYDAGLLRTPDPVQARLSEGPTDEQIDDLIKRLLAGIGSYTDGGIVGKRAGLIREVAAALSSERERAGKAERERDEARRQHDEIVRADTKHWFEHRDRADAAQAELTQLRADIAERAKEETRLREALFGLNRAIDEMWNDELRRTGLPERHVKEITRWQGVSKATLSQTASAGSSEEGE